MTSHPEQDGSPTKGARGRPANIAVLARGEPFVWLTGGAMVVAIAMIVGLLALILVRGLGTFWPGEVSELRTRAGLEFLGEQTREEAVRLTDEARVRLDEDSRRRLEGEESFQRVQIRTGRRGDVGVEFTWLGRHEIEEETQPEWVLTVERRREGIYYGIPTALLIDGEVSTRGAEAVWRRFEEFHPEVLLREDEVETLRNERLGGLSRELNEARLDVRRAEISSGVDSEAHRSASEAYAVTARRVEIASRDVADAIASLRSETGRYALRFAGPAGADADVIPLQDIVRAYPANRLDLGDRLGVYASRWSEFLTEEPRQANRQGGVYPAIFGTILMTLIMTIFVVPFGVLAALYLREYAQAGPVISAVRVAVNNLAGVPSIVFGVFGLGFFCYTVGYQIDHLFFAEYLPEPKFGTGGLLWASLTLALLTLPVVIVTTEEALAAVPGSVRAGSYACGASKWQTIRRIVLPRAAPGIMTGAILAMARGAGEVAPLMLVGAVKLAPEMAVDSQAPFLHLDRSFMHLGFHIFDLGFQSQDSEAAKPMVFTTTLLLIVIVAFLNVAAVALRSRINRRFQGEQF